MPFAVYGVALTAIVALTAAAAGVALAAPTTTADAAAPRGTLLIVPGQSFGATPYTLMADALRRAGLLESVVLCLVAAGRLATAGRLRDAVRAGLARGPASALVASTTAVAVAADLDALEATLRRGNAVVDSLRVVLPSNGAGLTAALGVHGLRPDVVPPAAPRRADGLAHRGVTASARREPAARVEPTVERVGTGYRFVLDLPEVTADEVELSRHDDALQLSAHGTMRVVPLPPGLRRCAVERAGLAGGRLTLDLVPDPARWPR